MIIWLNGTFGAGKTTTAHELIDALPNGRIFDAEQVGYMLRTINGLPALGDFQHWPPWRALVVETARHVLDYVGGTLVIPQTVLVQQYWHQISAGLAAANIPLRHVLLHAELDTLSRRIELDRADNRQWRLDHLAHYTRALEWLTAEADVVNTTSHTPRDTAELITSTLGDIE